MSVRCSIANPTTMKHSPGRTAGVPNTGAALHQGKHFYLTQILGSWQLAEARAWPGCQQGAWASSQQDMPSTPLWEQKHRAGRNGRCVCAGQGSHTRGVGHGACALPPKLLLFSPVYLQPRHSRGAWWSGNTWGTLRERRHNQTQKKALPHCWGAGSGGWASRGALADKRRHRGDKRHTPAGPAARSCPSKVPEHPGWEWGVAKERLQATSTPSAGLRGEAAGGGAQSPVGPLRVGLGGAGPLPGLGEALSATHRHAGEDWVSSRGTGALPGLTLEDRSLCQRRAGVGDLRGTGMWEAAPALGMERPGFKSRTCLLGTGLSARPL